MDQVQDGFRMDGCKLSHDLICLLWFFFFLFSLCLDTHPRIGHFDHCTLLKNLKLTKKSLDIWKSYFLFHTYEIKTIYDVSLMGTSLKNSHAKFNNLKCNSFYLLFYQLAINLDYIIERCYLFPNSKIKMKSTILKTNW